MPAITHRPAVNKQEIDELLELIEDKYLGRLMRRAEKEKDIPLAKAKKSLR